MHIAPEHTYIIDWYQICACGYFFARVPACLPPCLPASLPASLPACLSVCLSVSVNVLLAPRHSEFTLQMCGETAQIVQIQCFVASGCWVWDGRPVEPPEYWYPPWCCCTNSQRNMTINQNERKCGVCWSQFIQTILRQWQRWQWQIYDTNTNQTGNHEARYEYVTSWQP